MASYICFKRFGLDIIEGNKRSSTWNKIYETILTPVLCFKVLAEFIGFKQTNFNVTLKIHQTIQWKKKIKSFILAFKLIYIKYNWFYYVYC